MRLDRRVGGVHAGSSGFLYGLDSLGQRLLDTAGPAGGTRRRRPWQPSAWFQDHVLAVAEVYVCLREDEHASRSIVLQWQGEPHCWRTFTTPLGTTVLKPDAFVRIDVGAFEQLSFIELDRATEHTPTLRRKLAAYCAAFEAGIEQADGDAFPNVVWIVPDGRRAQQLERLIARLPEPHRRLFAVATPDTQLTTLKGDI